MNEERTLRDLYAYNTWGNEQVFAACRNLDPTQVRNEAPGTRGTIEETLKHMVGVEEVYLHMLRGQPMESTGGREKYFDQDTVWFEQRSRQLGEEYQALLSAMPDSFYDEELKVPWFDFKLTKHDGLIQVLTHSAQHRAQIFSVLGQWGLEVPNVDYVLFVQGRGKQSV